MFGLNYMYSLILIYLILRVHSQGSKDVLGPASCSYYGMLKSFCSTPDILIENLPQECTSFNYMYLKVENNQITDIGAQYGSVQGSLDKLIQTKKNVVLYYYHETMADWCAAIQCNNTQGLTTEMSNLKTFLDQHKGIKGICLCHLLTSPVPSANCPNYTQNMKSYIDLIHTTFPDLGVGINIVATQAKVTYNDPKVTWLDFKVLDPCVDFYIIAFDGLNPCTDCFLKTGIYPLHGNNTSMDAMRPFLDEAGIPSQKTHYTIDLLGEQKGGNTDYCATIPEAYCKKVDEAKKTICVDTIQSLTEKGAYAKQYGAGFVVNKIDCDDTCGTCQCGQPYPAFHAILNGYNGAPPSPPCALYDRT